MCPSSFAAFPPAELRLTTLMRDATFGKRRRVVLLACGPADDFNTSTTEGTSTETILDVERLRCADGSRDSRTGSRRVIGSLSKSADVERGNVSMMSILLGIRSLIVYNTRSQTIPMHNGKLQGEQE